MTHPNCLIHQPRCGLQDGNPICPKCGLDERVRYVNEEAGKAALNTALAAWAVADQAETTQPEAKPFDAPPAPQPPELKGVPAKQQPTEPKPPVPPVPEPPDPPNSGAKYLMGAVLAVLLAGGGYQYWQQQKALELVLKKQQQMQQAQEQQVRQAREQSQATEREKKQASQAAPDALDNLLGKMELERPKEPMMVVVPSGSFQMGKDRYDGRGYDWEAPLHNVYIKSFAIGKYEVTQGQWRAIMGSNPSNFDKCGDNCPVEMVSWNDIQSYIQKLNQKTGKQYRLPSEAEWEYACRGGQRHDYCGSDNLGSVAWYDENSSRTPHFVGQKKPNSFGLYDMSGNVAEWVEDCKHDSYIGAPSDGRAWIHGCVYKGRVVRGGSWYAWDKSSRAAGRTSNTTDEHYPHLGFRLARSLP